ncbi:hypothetical protein BDA96_02G073500 [Sorghum bicolor]|uniref:Uncharacterized protein n=2 Tax=Sorghum bicolor TaxID=4558 RepID=A0A921RN87_SORBI|nr:disease resistance protein RPP13 isoform X1 [Sorghum bicolor]KAG0542092.1 hypothetical protein BDA96_02G073500 [Sorghum bicolor]KXG34643.2 hypothetical protein SORBI_3002G071850 [Sorghum bicolor]|eukprot:XP_021310596.1 disease resistance protein RPP13 isoform X1 [Sorghum bicolor]
MEAAVVSVGKAALNGLLSGAKSTIAEESSLTQAVQRDMVFLADELEEMHSILRDVVQQRDYHKVPRSRVKQLRSLAHDVEDCLQEYSVHLEKPSGWRLARTVLERHRIAAEMKGLRARVEDMNQRNLHHQLMHNAGSKPAVWGTSGCLGQQASSSSIIPSATMFGIAEARRQKDKAKVDLSWLINEGNEDLRVIAVWGTKGVLGQSVLINGAYNDLKRSKKFELYAWIRIVHPFNPLEFLHCVMRQFYSTSFEQARKTQEKANIGSQVLKKMSMMEQHDLVDQFCEHVSEKSYLIVLNDMSTIEDWHAIKEYFPDNRKGSRIIVSTEHGEVASLCTGQESIVAELNQPYVDQSIFASHDKDSQFQTALMEPSHTTLGTNNSVVPTDDIVENQFVDDNDNIARKSLRRLGTMTCALDDQLVVGREKEKSELISLISKEDDEQTMVISVWGMGGLGKTTLVKEVYQSQELSDLFEKRACVTIIRPFVLDEVLKSLAMQLRGESFNRKDNIDFGIGIRKLTETKLLTEELGHLTKRKRCLIVLDDLFSVVEWGMIIQSLPKMENASRILITTRERNIAKHCSRNEESIYNLQVLNPWDSLDLFTRKVFKEVIDLDEYPALIQEAKTILKRCSGLPLAIVNIGGFLANQPKTPIVWRKMNEHISAELEMNPELGIIRAILMKTYDGLPYHLKYCFLYMSIFPEDYTISRRRLVHRWKAEGYSSDEVRGKSMGEIVDAYFMELIERSMVLPSKESIGSRKGISSCKLHDLMREISISKAMEENLVFRMEEGCSLYTQGTMRHLAISNNWEGNQNEFECTVDLSRIRSLTVFGKWKPFYISDKMKLLRVLDLESTSGLVDHHIEPIGKLLHLKYLSLRECDGIFHLPESLGNLEQLETLDVTNTRIMKLPQTITKLRKLQHIHAGNVCNRILDSSS